MYDTIIIGSGPAGLSAAIYAARAKLNAVVIEKEYLGTGQIANSHRVDNYPGLFGESGYDLGEKLRNHAAMLGALFEEGEVAEIGFSEGVFEVKTDSHTLSARTVIYAAGAQPRRLGVKGEDKFSGRGVSTCAVCDGAFYEGGTVAVVGGGDTALYDAAELAKIAETVYLIHRREEFRANKTIQGIVKNTHNIIPILSAEIKEIDGTKNVEKIVVSVGGENREIKTDGVFVAIGSDPNTHILRGTVELDGGGYIITDESGKTSLPGFFAAGDVRTKPLRQAVTAAADGANCAVSAERYILGNK